MSAKRTLGFVAALCAVSAALAVGGAVAQDWRRGDYEYMKEPHHFGPLCQYGIRARGAAPVALFGGAREVKKAEARSIRDWESEAAHLFGAPYGGWDLAMGKEVRCEVKGLEFVCVAAGYPCRRR